MSVDSVLDAISSGDYLLELSIDSNLPEDIVIHGAISERANPVGRGRTEFVFRNESQSEFLSGIAKLINAR